MSIEHLKDDTFRVRAQWAPRRPVLGTYKTIGAAEAVHDMARGWNRIETLDEPFAIAIDAWLEYTRWAAESCYPVLHDPDVLAAYTASLREELGELSVAEALEVFWHYRHAADDTTAKDLATRRLRQLKLNRRFAKILHTLGISTDDAPQARQYDDAPTPTPTKSEIESLLAHTRDTAADDRRDLSRVWPHTAILLAAGLGLDGKEILALRWNDVDLRNLGVIVRRTLGEATTVGGWRACDAKASRCRYQPFSAAVLGLESELRDALEKQRRLIRGEHKSSANAARREDDSYVFPGYVAPLKPKNLSKVVDCPLQLACTHLTGGALDARPASEPIKPRRLNNAIREAAVDTGLEGDLRRFQPFRLRRLYAHLLWEDLSREDDQLAPGDSTKKDQQARKNALRHALGLPSIREVDRFLSLEAIK